MKYTRAFEIAQFTLWEREARGERYRPDVLRLAALAAVETSNMEAAIEAMTNTFLGARVSLNPRWDGSIA